MTGILDREAATMSTSQKTCSTCSNTSKSEDFVTCGGICERSFHATLKCSGLRNDYAKIVSKVVNLSFVCDECRSARMFHVLESVRTCNTNVLLIRDKFDNVHALLMSSTRRLSTLETSVNDVTGHQPDDGLNGVSEMIVSQVESMLKERLSELWTFAGAKLKCLAKASEFDEQLTIRLEKERNDQLNLLTANEKLTEMMTDMIQKQEILLVL